MEDRRDYKNEEEAEKEGRRTRTRRDTGRSRRVQRWSLRTAEGEETASEWPARLS